MIPYPTAKNIKVQLKAEGLNQWYLQVRFCNMKYPLKKVEFSTDGKIFKEINLVNGKDNNWYRIGYKWKSSDFQPSGNCN